MVTLRPDFGNPPVNDRTLLNSQKQDVREAIESEGLEIQQFTWVPVRSSEHQRPDVVVLQLNHLSGFFFLFNSTRDGQHFYTRSPGIDSKVESGKTGRWHPQLRAAQRWLSLLKKEIETPDPWEMLGDGFLARAGAEGTENTPFNNEEISRIAEDVGQIKRFLFENENLRPGHRAFVENQLNTLVENSKRLGRKDWLSLTLGVLIQTVVGLALPQEIAQTMGHQLISLADVTFGWISRRPLFFPPTF